MSINNLRTSTCNSYDDCAWKYFLHYVVNFHSVPNLKADCGSQVHLAAELLAKAKKTGHYKLNDKFCDPDYLVDIIWQRYTKNNQYNLPYKDADKKFIRKQLQNILDSDLNPFKLDILDTEKQFEIEIRLPGFEYKHKNVITGKIEEGFMKLRGTIDLITIEDKDTISVQDYKTGQMKSWATGKEKTLDDFKKDLQFRVYDVATKTIYPQFKYRLFTMFYTQTKTPFTVSFSDKEYKQTLEILKQKFQKIKNDRKFERLLDNSARKNELFKCIHVCEFGKVRHTFINDEAGYLEKEFKYDKSGYYPNEIVENNKTYYRITSHSDSLCTQYRKIFEKNNIESAAKKLYDISVKGEPLKVSKRNDYGNSKIFRGVIQ